MKSRRQRRVSTPLATDTDRPYRLLFQLNPNPMWVSDEETLRFLAVNQAAIRLYGYTRAEFLARTIKDIRPPAEVPRLLAALDDQRGARVQATGAWLHRKKDSTVFDAEVTVSSIAFQGRAARLAMVQDITERRRAETAIEESEKRYRAVVETLTELVCRFDPDQTLTFVNEAYCRYFGRRREDLIGRKFMPLIPKEDRLRVREHFAAFSPQRPVATHEHRVIAPGGEVRWQQWTNQAFFDEHGQLLGFQAVGRDVTKRKRAEDALRQLMTELEQRVAERTAELREEISQRHQLERRILEISEREQRRIGHDLHDSLGQHLAALKFMSSSLSRRLARQKAPGALSAARISRELDQALDEVRAIARGLHPIRPDGESLMSALYELAASVQKLFKIPCRFECPQPVVVHDYQTATHFYRLVQEAVSNAARHGRPKHIWITLQEVDGTIDLRVEDDGQGLPPPAKQPDGLGLHIMQYRASLIGALFQIDRRPGGGTRITCAWNPTPTEEPPARDAA